MSHYLVFTALGTDRTGIVSEITKLTSEFGCNIDDSRMAILGKEFTLVMLLSGSKSAINQIESRLPILAHSLALLTIIKRTTQPVKAIIKECLEVEINGKDSKGILKQVTQFFAKRKIDLTSIKTVADPDKDIITTSLLINLSELINKQQLEDEFQQLCQTLAVTGSFKTPTNFIL